MSNLNFTKMTEQERELMKHFKVEELEERLEMKKHWGANCGGTNQTCGAVGSGVTH